MIDVWRADFGAATLTANEAIERAELLGGDHRTVIAHSALALVGAYIAREHDARVDALAAIDGANRCGSVRLADTAVMALRHLDVTLGNHAKALTRLRPLIAGLETLPGTELGTTAFIPDAVEAMLALGHHSEAEPLIEVLGHPFTRRTVQGDEPFAS